MKKPSTRKGIELRMRFSDKGYDRFKRIETSSGLSGEDMIMDALRVYEEMLRHTQDVGTQFYGQEPGGKILPVDFGVGRKSSLSRLN